MNRIKIKPNDRKGPVRMDITLQNTSRGQVQRFKYFPSTERTSAVESREENMESTIDTQHAYADFADQCDESASMHKRSTGKVRDNYFDFACDLKENRHRMIIFGNGKVFEMPTFMLCLKRKPLRLS